MDKGGLRAGARGNAIGGLPLTGEKRERREAPFLILISDVEIFYGASLSFKFILVDLWEGEVNING